jgi:hypothetical protein
LNLGVRLPIFIFKAVLYVLTAGSALVFGFWEFKLRDQLTDEKLEQQDERPSDYGLLYGLKRQLRREGILRNFPPETRSKYKMIVGLKFFFMAILIAEVIILQR